MNWVAIIVGVIAGTTIVLQSTVSAKLSTFIGLWQTTFIVHIVGVVASFIPLFLFRHEANWSAWNQAPWYVYLGGVFGVIIIYTVAYTVSNSGVTAGISLIIASQLVVTLLIDHFGWMGMSVRPVTLMKVAGVAFLFMGAWLVLREG